MLFSPPTDLGRSWLAGKIYRALVSAGVDFLPLDSLARKIGVAGDTIRRAAEVAPYLGVLPAKPEPLIYCVPPQPLAAGFTVRHREDRLMLWLPGRGLYPALMINGRHVGRVPGPERELTLGAGELAHTVSRLTLMAESWLPCVPDPSRYLFELIVAAWGQRPACRLDGFGVHRASFDGIIATHPDGGTNRLELVTNRRRSVHQLVNVYPIPAQGWTA